MEGHREQREEMKNQWLHGGAQEAERWEEERRDHWLRGGSQGALQRDRRKREDALIVAVNKLWSLLKCRLKDAERNGMGRNMAWTWTSFLVLVVTSWIHDKRPHRHVVRNHELPLSVVCSGSRSKPWLTK